MKKRFHTVTAKESPIPLVDFLAAHLNCSLRKAKRLLDERNVFVNRKRVWMARHVVRSGDVVECSEVEQSPTDRMRSGITILYDNADYLVVDKPPGLLSNGPESLETRLKQQQRESGLRVAHRLDRDTSGCLLVARNRDAFDRAVQLFREKKVLKIYRAIVLGRPDTTEGVITNRVDGATATTHWTVLSSVTEAAHVQLKIETGRTHQIRKHMSGMGHPVLGDRQYYTGRLDDPRFRAIPRQMLHASSFQAPLGAGNKTVRVHASLPRDFRNVLKQFGLKYLAL